MFEQIFGRSSNDPFQEKQKKDGMSANDILKYNKAQKMMHGIPLDPCKSRKVNSAVASIITVLNERNDENDKAQLSDILHFLLRSNGPHEDMTLEEKERVISIITEYYS